MPETAVKRKANLRPVSGGFLASARTVTDSQEAMCSALLGVFQPIRPVLRPPPPVRYGNCHNLVSLY